ncbi:hypothetical protein [Cellulomonas sp. ATA003]|uniref:hypothetical protein n=1 Tax=Cellulomonas sp. ATA003 TaxID=3073064 RepID=UPI0028734B05|nr:hypothetical protein [Cellulomonas sp. ATA003]WNB87029.1 hypothetical protein REH70_07800 [Cellulomonas sp. ATA003]
MTSDAATLPLTTTAMDTPERRMLSWLALAAGLALTVTTGATLLGAPATPTDPHMTPWSVTSEAGPVDSRTTDASGTDAVWSAPAALTTGGATSAG